MGTGQISQPAGGGLAPGTQDAALAAEDNIFDELRTTKCSSWQFELRQMEKVNRILAEELGGLLSNKKKRKRRKGVGNMVRDCANCHTRNTPEWRRGPSGQRDLCNSCGLRWAKQVWCAKKLDHGFPPSNFACVYRLGVFPHETLLEEETTAMVMLRARSPHLLSIRPLSTGNSLRTLQIPTMAPYEQTQAGLP